MLGLAGEKEEAARQTAILQEKLKTLEKSNDALKNVAAEEKEKNDRLLAVVQALSSKSTFDFLHYLLFLDNAFAKVRCFC